MHVVFFSPIASASEYDPLVSGNKTISTLSNWLTPNHLLSDITYMAWFHFVFKNLVMKKIGHFAKGTFKYIF